SRSRRARVRRFGGRRSRRTLLIAPTSGDRVSIRSPASESQPLTGAGADQQMDTSPPPPGNEPLPGTVEVEHPAPGLAVVNVTGEHDVSTAPELTQALDEAAAYSNVLVDLSECSFMD